MFSKPFNIAWVSLGVEGHDLAVQDHELGYDSQD